MKNVSAVFQKSRNACAVDRVRKHLPRQLQFDFPVFLLKFCDMQFYKTL